MNQKIGRNQPCPCGSGEKYKKCCMAKDAARESQARTEAAATRQQATAVAERLALSYSAPEKPPPERPPSSQLLLLSNERICQRLASYGIEVTAEAFPELARGRARSWSIAEELWLPALSEDVADDDRQFICLAACELWRRTSEGGQGGQAGRWRRWLAAGYERSRANDDAGASSAWSPLGEWLLPQLTPLMQDVDAADALLEDAEFMLNWLQDYAAALYNAALQQPAYAQQGIRFYEPFLEHFAPQGEDDVLLPLRCFLGEFFVLAGERQRGEAVLTAIMRAHPEKSAGYATLAAALTLRSDDPADRERAIALLEQALARPVVDPEDWDLEARLEDLREPSVTQPDPPPPSGPVGAAGADDTKQQD